ncbi:FtsK/SpoIIIE domain-containing protein [Knoellia sp. CPCC 206450]|uniref:FtsK/SpoIIIE domain-containing protein n=1 Tax=Knoellia tibetensis TaxID=3404798 RepID=UPI003B43AAE8
METAVELDLTVLLPTRRGDALDVRVAVPAGTTLGEVLPLLAETLGTQIDRVTSRGVEVDPTSVVGLPPLLHGATLVVGEPPRSAPCRATPTDLVVVAGPDAGWRHPLPVDGLVVGRSAGLGLSLDDDRISRRHVSIAPSDNGFRIADLGSTNGTRCGDVTLTSESEVAVVDGSDLVAVGSSLLRLDRAGSACAPTRPDGSGRLAVNRAPRTLPPEVAATVRAPSSPSPPRRVRIPWLAALLPLPFAALLALVVGPQMLAFALLSPLMVVGSVVSDRFGSRRDHAREVEAHEVLLARRQEELNRLLALERRQRWHAAPDAATVLTIASGPGTRVWERRPTAPDFGRLRVGVGELPSRTGWVPPNGEVEHPPLRDVPVEVDLERVGGLGIAGPASEVEAVLRHLVGQLATLHSPRDLELVVPVAGRDAPLRWAGWLPHTTAYGPVERCVDVLREVVAAREEERERGTSATAPRVVVVLSAADDADPELLDLLERGRDLGVRCLVGARHVGALPGSCHAVVGLGQGVDGSARLDVDAVDPVPGFVPDLVGPWWGERIGRALAPLVDVSGGRETLPDDVDLLDLVGWLDARAVRSGSLGVADDVVRHWRSGSGRPVARLGRRVGGEWTIDLASDGPHLLVGGTTGSGKSELLRTLVTSLALECSPEDVSFVLVDYKGGSAFGECADLPHTVGSVTNLDEGLAARALLSLGAEITRRERLLAESGARDFEEHRRLAGSGSGSPLPRLVIVVDEFRLLAEDLPDFVDGVVGLAAVGRSLGVHLVLATQRPAGAVTPDIAANVNLRIAMRVRDAADSHDVVGAPDAARLSPGTPGRGLARGGDGALVEFQAARVGAATAQGGARVTVLSPDGEPTRLVVSGSGVATGPPVEGERAVCDGLGSGLGALVRLLRAAATSAGVPAPHRPWLPPLSEVLELAHVGPQGVGLVDLPLEQGQTVLTHAPDGHWLVVGGPRSGRTAALRTVLAAHLAGPGTRHAWVVDTTGELADLEALPQVGAVVRADDGSRVRRLLDRLRARADAEGPTASGLLLVDGWDRLDAASGLGLGGLQDDLLDLLRAGDTTLCAVVAGDRTALSSRLGSVVTETLLLPLADPADATYAGLSRRDLPSSRVPGRALRLRDRAEVQLARRDPMAEALLAVARETSARKDSASGATPPVDLGPEARDLLPFAVPTLPTRVDRAELAALVRPSAGPEALAIGLSADTGGVALLDPAREGRRILVAGHPRTGRSTTLASIGAAAVEAGRVVAVVEGPAGSVATAVRAAAEDTGATNGADAGPQSPADEAVRVVRVDPWRPEPLVEARRTHPDLVVLVDDADRIEGTPVEAALLELTALVDRDGGLVVAACATPSVAAQFRGVVPAVARAQTGLLLAPRAPGDGEAFGIRAPRGFAPGPGRALLVSGREAVELQVALAPPTNKASSDPASSRPASPPASPRSPRSPATGKPAAAPTPPPAPERPRPATRCA